MLTVRKAKVIAHSANFPAQPTGLLIANGGVQAGHGADEADFARPYLPAV